MYQVVLGFNIHHLEDSEHSTDDEMEISLTVAFPDVETFEFMYESDYTGLEDKIIEYLEDEYPGYYVDGPIELVETIGSDGDEDDVDIHFN